MQPPRGASWAHSGCVYRTQSFRSCDGYHFRLCPSSCDGQVFAASRDIAFSPAHQILKLGPLARKQKLRRGTVEAGLIELANG